MFSIRRRRICNACGFRFSTVEFPVREEIMVRKRSGRLEEFDREKIHASFQMALKRGSFQRQQIDALVDEITATLSIKEKKSVDSSTIGMAVLQKLKNLDELAYLRYLSVHQTFSNLEDFRKQVFQSEESCDDTI
ncbi:MAG: hypothetical protein LBI69_04575 [Puniceicoccales bacterium]|jgi:transcriptional repressor NrdR|nr:hypothetical protein [Puniceicoccales bacterium]